VEYRLLIFIIMWDWVRRSERIEYNKPI